MLYVKVGHHVQVLHPFTGRTPCPSAAPPHRSDIMSECCTPSQVGHHVRVLHPPHRSDTMSECCTPSQVGHHVRVLHPPHKSDIMSECCTLLTGRTPCPSAPIVCNTYHHNHCTGTYQGNMRQKMYVD